MSSSPLAISFLRDGPRSSGTWAIPVSTGTAIEDCLPASIVEVARYVGAGFRGEPGSIVELHAVLNGAVRRILLVGTGSDRSGATAGKALIATLRTTDEEELIVDATAIDIGHRVEFAASLAQAALLRSWRFAGYHTAPKPGQGLALRSIEIVVGDVAPGAEAAFAPLRAAAEGTAFARSLVTEPGNILYPESFVERCRELEPLGVEVEVLDAAAMRALGMGALLGVAQGSAREPRLLCLRWDGTNGQADPVAFVGKGVTFDSGGISIKTTPAIGIMKSDMGGAAAVAGALKALALRSARAHVIGLCGLVENMPDGKAQRPGDVVTTASGRTVEVLDTDAEGRLVLCDLIWWVQQRYKPKTIIDLATLTGAIIVSLGHEYAGLFSNDDMLADRMLAAGRAVGEPLWRLPMGAAYDRLLDSPIADLANISPRDAGSREASSIVAAQFIARFVDQGVKWAHLDIAGMAWMPHAGPDWERGATGFGVRMLDRLVADMFEG